MRIDRLLQRKSFSGMDRRLAEQVARYLGVMVEDVRRTGEKRFSHPEFPHPVTINGRRHDCGRELTTMLFHLAKRRP